MPVFVATKQALVFDVKPQSSRPIFGTIFFFISCVWFGPFGGFSSFSPVGALRRNLGRGEEIGSGFLGSWGCGCRLGCGIVCRWWCHGVESREKRELGSGFVAETERERERLRIF
ncbi:hypothetical protein PRUPE_3G088800 [Prunus persica]|uniref:Transmembrane protein n=1 Tax=Prunus persica TaxID=3760 RepID=A0A251PXH8_PRUPE|nr:hypothetical protein PRUPE_3G088800 [Prunus persica]